MFSYSIAQQSGDSTNNYFYITQVQDAYYDSIIDIYGIDSMQGTGYKEYVRWKGYMQMRVDGDGMLDTYINCVNNYYDQPNQSSTTTWTYYSPVGVPTSGILNGSGKGWVNKILIDESNSSHIYAGTHNNGIWKTENNGYDWSCITSKYPKINGIASMCFNSNNEIYALTFSNISSYSNGLYKGTYNGDDWDWVYVIIDIQIGGQDFYPVSLKKHRFPKKVIVHPQNDNIIFVLTNSYILKYVAGANPEWSVVCDMTDEDEGFDTDLDEGFEDIVFDSGNDNTMYVSGTKIFKSTDAGNTWDTNDITQDVTGFESVQTCKMDVNTVNPDYEGKVWFFSAYKNYDNEDKVRITKYDPASGGNYTYFEEDHPPYLAAGRGKINIKVHPEIEERLYISGLQIFAVYYDDLGDKYIDKMITNRTNYSNYNYLHDDVRDLLFHHQGSWNLYIGCDAGVVKANEIAGDEEWATTDYSIRGDNRATDLNISEVFAISTSGNKGKIAFNCQDIGDYYFNNDNLHRFASGDGGAMLFDNLHTEYLFGCDILGAFFVYNTINNLTINLDVPFIPDSYFFPPIVKDPGNSNVIYFGSKHLWKYTDIYTTLEDENLEPPPVEIEALENTWPITDIEISHNNPDIMYVSTKRSFWNQNDPIEDALYKSIDGGQTWNDISTDITEQYKGFITDIELNPENDDELWLTFGYSTNKSKVDHYYKSGSSWISEPFDEELPEALPVFEMVIDEMNGDKYLATDLGVFKWTQEEPLWNNISKEGDVYKQRMVYDIEINHAERKLYASTFGGGIWYTELGDCSTVLNPPPMVIEENPVPVIWSKPMFVDGDVIIKPGAHLIIKDVVYLHENSKIIVQRSEDPLIFGGKLEIDGGKLTNSCNGDFWKGIEVWGHSDKNQNAVEQGWVYVHNNGCIENAEIGILANKASTYEETGFTGGVIRVNEGVFLNNKIAVKLENYTGESLTDFFYCTFEVNDNWQHDAASPGDFVILDDYNISPRFMACRFINKSAWYEGLGVGIKSINSSVFVNGLCANSTMPCDEYVNSEFTGLLDGIYASGANPTGSLLTVMNSVFTNNKEGVYVGAINNFTITSNTFTVKDIGEHYGLYVEKCTGYHIEDNTFIGLGNSQDNYGLYINGSGEYDNLVYNNYFENLYYGSVFQDINRITALGETGGLCVKCNDFVDNVYDIFIVGDKGIAFYQGSEVPTFPQYDETTYPAGNTFTDISSLPEHIKDIQDQSLSIIYYYHQYSEGNPNIYPDFVTGNVTRRMVNSTYYVKSLSCPPTLDGGGSIESLKSDMVILGADVDSTKNVLANLVDNSDTDELNFDVQTAMPNESIETRDMLLEASPNLSDTVMISAIEAENVLPDAMVRDVLVENPQAAKSTKVQDALDERTNQLPGYMRVQISAGVDTLSEVEVTRAYLSDYQQKYEKAFNRLHYLYAHDTLVVNVNDSLMALYELKGGLLNKYRIAWMHFVEGDTITSDSLINQIQYEFELTSNQEVERQDYLTYMGIVNKMRNDSITFPDSVMVAQLFNLMLSDNGMPAVYARNMLVFAGEYVYNEPLLKADTSFKTTVYNNNFVNTGIDTVNKQMTIMPNPAYNYFIISYKLSSNTSRAYLSIVDIGGNYIDNIEIVDAQNAFVINTSGWKPGTYIVSLHREGSVIESKKINLIK